MFKITGSIMIIIAITYFFSEKLLKSCFTYRYLEEIINLLYQMKNACRTGKTYRSVIDSLDRNEYKLYFSELKEFCVDKRRLRKTDMFFSSAGKRNRKEETELLQHYIDQAEKYRYEYKEYFDTNKKSVFLSGIYLGIVIVIVFM